MLPGTREEDGAGGRRLRASQGCEWQEGESMALPPRLADVSVDVGAGELTLSSCHTWTLKSLQRAHALHVKDK